MKQLAIAATLAVTVSACASIMPPPGPGPGGSVSGTNWRVVAVNGRATPRMGEFYMRFEQSRFGAKFGCNGLGADYMQRGNIIDPGPVIGTQMACSDMSFERQGGIVLSQDMRTVWNGPGSLRLVNQGGTIDLRR